jgi:hypothetical protein
MSDNIHWGKSFWDLIHNISILFPENPTQNDINMFGNFLDSIQMLLPCEQCRIHFKQNLESFPISSFMKKSASYFSSKDGIILWCIKVHNKVNKMINKFISVTEDKYGIEFVKKKYSSGNVLLVFKSMLKQSLDRTQEIKEKENSYYNLFHSVSYFLLNINIDITKILNNKSQKATFNTKSSILKIYQTL